MRGRLGLFRNPSSIRSTTIGRNTAKLVSSSAFSSSSAGDGFGGGRGRGRGGSGSSFYNFISGADSNEGLEEDSDKSLPPAGRGHGQGRGIPLRSSPYLPSYDSFVAPNASGLSRGRGGPVQESFEGESDQESGPKRPIFLKKDEVSGASVEADSVSSVPPQPIGEKILLENMLNVFSGTGRGVPERKPVLETRPKEQNRHLRLNQAASSPVGARRQGAAVGSATAAPRPNISREQAIKNALGILSQGADKEGGDGGKGSRRRGGRSKYDEDDDDEDDEDVDKLLCPGDDKDGENLAKVLGPSRMAKLTEAFEEMSTDVLPDPEEDEFLEALDTNIKIELEPEYLMGDFETNPDINETPPIPLREALEKMKPFLMAYDGIESQEEWEEVLKETMDKVPLFKEIVDHYCGPDRVTAKQQNGELERVAKTLPVGVPNSVKNFTNRAVLSLQSNPGWGFHRKCQFMDKLVVEVSKAHK